MIYPPRGVLLGAPLAILVACASSCSHGPASGLRPANPTAAGAMDEPVTYDVSGPSEPLIVDWKSNDLQNLEFAMKSGVVVIGYDNKHMAILPDCHVDGSYRFTGSTRLEDVKQLKNADDVKACIFSKGRGSGSEAEAGALRLTGACPWTCPPSTSRASRTKTSASASSRC